MGDSTRPPYESYLTCEFRVGESVASRIFRVGSRASALAMTQARSVVASLSAASPSAGFQIVTVSTRGDQVRDVPITVLGQGAFVKAIEAELLAGNLDMAVHSLKDVPVDGDGRLVLAAFPAREDPSDALVTHDGRPLRELPLGATVATGSPRRAAQLLAIRPDLQVEGIRGNLDTRLRKVRESGLDGLVVALAGLRRLGMANEVAEVFPPDQFVPAAGQGALVVQCRKDDEESMTVAALVDHPPTRQAVAAERSFLRSLGGGCRVPVGAYAVIQGQSLRLVGLLVSRDGAVLLRAEVTGPPDHAEDLGQVLAARLLEEGGRRLLEGEQADAGR